MINQYMPLTPKLCWLLAAPHTWPAAIFPVLLALAFTVASNHSVSVVAAMILLLISICCQSAVNTLNDYFDYIKGIDTKDDNVEADDSVLVYNNVNPRSVLMLAIGFLVAALALGIYCIYVAGWIPLVIAALGALAIVLYSGGKTPISFLPIGEVISGFVMGGLITFASYVVLTGDLNWLVLVWSIPLIVGIALIMMTNNTCDIEKDQAHSRHTLPALLGRSRSVKLYRTLMICWYVFIIAISAIWFTPGLLVVPFMILGAYAPTKAILSNPLEPTYRISAMAQICNLNITLHTFYALCILAAGASVMI